MNTLGCVALPRYILIGWFIILSIAETVILLLMGSMCQAMIVLPFATVLNMTLAYLWKRNNFDCKFIVFLGLWYVLEIILFYYLLTDECPEVELVILIQCLMGVFVLLYYAILGCITHYIYSDNAESRLIYDDL